MSLVTTRIASATFETDKTAVDELIARADYAIKFTLGADSLAESQQLISESRERATTLTKRIAYLSANPSQENILETSKYLKLQTRLALSIGAIVKHIGTELRTKSRHVRALRATTP